ncbi:hypothetical protein [Devosia sp. CN2-171]|uniref:hypothetical protein n=1 Tax=Devosia sp. CN2-171 TaxID=3400909 RepID=UPI003BF7F85A
MPGSSWEELVRRVHGLGWYAGTHDLITVRVQGGFEAFNRRASEDWEVQFVITTTEVKDDKGTVIWPKVEAKASKLEDAAREALRKINNPEIDIPV